MENKSNRLIHEKNPYLLQHAHNPVDWYPWCEEAFKKASDENRPIFLSIGYSTCHWCHVMEKESFEDSEVARLMNNELISIKVDREERPDLDNVYMAVCQMLTGSGGWPLTIIMTPDKVPFYAGTYIPRNTRFGRIGMMELIPRIKDIWENRKTEVFESAKKIQEALKGMDDLSSGEKMGIPTLEKAYWELTSRFDKEFGGFGNAPKFPGSHNFLFLLRYWKRTGDKKALEMVEKSILKMRLGGMYDHIGFGFHRYSTDREWLVPHFEKMLYDQAMLAMVYLETFQATGNMEYAVTAREILTYVQRDMTSPEGGFYSAEDADSEGVEGKFYVWKEDELRKILQKEDAELIIELFNLKKEGNFKEESTGAANGTNIFHLKKPLHEIAEESNMTLSELEMSLSRTRHILFGERGKRIHPCKDDKILIDWNGLMIAAFAMGARILDEEKYTKAAINAADFIVKIMRDENGGLFHRFRENEAAIPGNADDYAFFVWGMIELYETTFDARYLRYAIELNEYFVAHFHDTKRGGFFFTPDNGEALLVRKREIYDGAIPSGNSVAVMNLLRLARITERNNLEQIAGETLIAFSGVVNKMPSAHSFLMTALDFEIGPSCEVIVTGFKGDNDTNEMIKTLDKIYKPNKVAVFRPIEGKPEIDALIEYLNNYEAIDNMATAYVCHNNACESPTTSVDRMLELLERS